jgi:hypothetical protein
MIQKNTFDVFFVFNKAGSEVFVRWKDIKLFLVLEGLKDMLLVSNEI